MAIYWPAYVGNTGGPGAAVIAAYPRAWSRKGDPHDTPSAAAAKIAPVLVLVTVVLGGIYGGFFTPTESGAAGAFFALVIALVKRTLT